MNRFLAAAALASFAIPATALAQAPNGSSREKLVVTTAWLVQHLHDPDLVILHVDDRDAYDAGHIPGARYADDHDVAVMDAPSGLSHEMPSTQVLHDNLAALGISDTSHVIVYGVWTASTRMVLTLDYVGLNNVSWLDGGLEGWTRAGQPLSKEAPMKRIGKLSPLAVRPIIADAAFVQAHLRAPGFAVVDGRKTTFYDGSSKGGANGHQKAGHLPGAGNVPFDTLLTGDMTLKSADDLTAIFAKAGVKPGDTVIGYCHIGIQATAALFAARTLGHPVMLYDGSFEDWSLRDLPVEK
jgi:thiosulfate/3-mercaptopyruvate sulfurtransferase